MIIEGAFLKLPELLLGNSSNRQYEATLVNHFSMGILLELNARNITMPVQRTHIERSYIPSGGRSPGRADLYVNLSSIHNLGIGHSLYGMKDHNWIEAKYFGSIAENNKNQQRTKYSAAIALDLLRLCLFVKEDQSTHRPNGRYLLMIFNRNPKNYISFNKEESIQEQSWTKTLLSPGYNDTHIDLSKEPPAFHNSFFIKSKNTRRSQSIDSNLSLKIFSFITTFSPFGETNEHLYWGYLVRIIDFELTCFGKTLIYKDTSKELWTQEQVETQQFLIQTLINNNENNS